MKLLKAIKNILWILLGGLWLAVLWGTVGVLLCLTIVGVPFGVQCFKLAKLSFLPFEKKIITHFKEHPVANIIWAFLGGWEMALIYLTFGIANCITIIGIPKGIQCFKIMKLAFVPFGAKIK